jgi:glutathione S-transferase
MLLYSTPTSPFGRKAKIAAFSHGLRDRIEIVKADPWSEGDVLRQVNPLGKMPALITEDGTAIYDSGVILDYFDHVLGEPRLFPTDRALATRVTHALGSGLIEAALLITYERQRRPKEFTYEPWVEHQLGKLTRGLAKVDASPPDCREIDAGSISVACALGYLDWRQQFDWRTHFPQLVAWLDTFRLSCPAFDETKSAH